MLMLVRSTDDALLDAGGKRLDVETLKANLGDFLSKLRDALPSAMGAPSGYHVQDFTISVGISATGSVGFLGTGAEATAEGSLTLTFKKD